MSPTLSVALAGNPNSGKTTLFNALTGSGRHVGNWPGKTVERWEGSRDYGGYRLTIVDLPGSYSLTASSLEEAVARDVLVDDRPDIVVVVVDAAHLERNLFLATQILEFGVTVIVGLNMMDTARAGGVELDPEVLADRLGVPVVPMIARNGVGIDALLATIVGAGVGEPAMTALRIDYGPTIERGIDEIEAAVAAAPAVAAVFPARWLALELLENGDDIRRRLAGIDGGDTVITAASDAYRHLAAEYGETAPVAVAGARYDWIHEVTGAATVARPASELSRSDHIDRVLTHPVAGLGFFLFALWAVFKLTADVATFFLDWIDVVVNGPIARWMASLVGAAGFGGSWLEDLMVSGVVAGVGGILVFLPVLLSLYLALAVLEDSGYMARGALVMDRLMRRLGLPAKSFLPMLVGFGCTVPAIYATRTLERRRDRVLTGLLVPFMSCGARLPVYVLMAAAFFPARRGLVVFAMYLLGVLVALVVGFVMSRTVLQSESTAPLLLELPAYRRPTWRSVWFHTWVRTKAFVKDAGTIILGTSIVLWLLLAIPAGGGSSFGDTPIEDSLFGRTTATLAPLFEPAGFGSAEATGALATGFVAKEVVISSMAQLYGTEREAPAAEPSFGEDVRQIGTGFGSAVRNTILSLPGIIGVDLVEDDSEPADGGLLAAIRQSFDQSSDGHGALAALAFCVFVLLYTPCMAAVAASRRELGTRWMWTSVIGQTALAWVMAVAVFQLGRASGLG